MQYSYIILDENAAAAQELAKHFEDFPEYYCMGMAHDRQSSTDLILESKPELVFLSLKKKAKTVGIDIIYDLYRYINVLPYFVVFSDTEEFAYESIKAGIFDYVLTPFKKQDLRRTLLKFQKEVPLSGAILPEIKENPQERLNAEDLFTQQLQGREGSKSDIDIQICIKSHGDYQFIALKDVVYLQADNNTTDFHLVNGKTLSAYKTLKHYENNLPSFFYRIHNSFVVNCNHVSRINTGKSLCYLNNNEVSIPFSKTFKENIDTIIKKIAPEFI